MKVEYAPRAKADLIQIGDYSRRVFGDAVAVAMETYIRASVARISVMPKSDNAYQHDGMCAAFRLFAILSKSFTPSQNQ